jgi:MarR family transcriptional regulator, organic hydroperoxide resistance regulator
MAKHAKDISGDDKRRAAQLMKRILIGFRTQMDEELRPRGVTTAELQILKAVQGAPGSSGAQLARVCYMTPQSMQSLIQKTEADGWIERRKGKGNERVLAASLTAAGEALLRDAESVVKRIEKRLWAGIPTDEIVGMVNLLERCLENIEPE